MWGSGVAYLRVTYLEDSLSQFSILLIRDVHIGTRALLDI
jgi:hypothetical protein